MALPKFLQSSLWSYDIKRMDIWEHKHTIIQQVLNYGTKEQIRWLFKTYPAKEIKNVLRRPGRGIWYRDVLNYWLTIFDVKIDKETYELAIRDLVPSSEKRKVLEVFWNRKLNARRA